MRNNIKTELLKGKKVNSRKKLPIQKNTSKTPAKKTSAVQDTYFKAIFDNAVIGIILVDSNRKILKFNQAVLNFLKYSEEEFSSISIDMITHPDDLESNLKLFKEIVSGKEKTMYF